MFYLVTFYKDVMEVNIKNFNEALEWWDNMLVQAKIFFLKKRGGFLERPVFEEISQKKEGFFDHISKKYTIKVLYQIVYTNA